MKPASDSRSFILSLVPFGVFILAAVCFFHEAIFFGKAFSARDHYLFFMPRRFFALDTLLDGSLPLWNPFNACGVPFLANVQSSVFYPLSTLIYLLPFPGGYCAFVIVHYVLAALFMFALMRHWNGSCCAAVIAGLVFAFGGYMQSISDNLAFLTAATWLPLIVLCLSKTLQERSLGWALATTALIGLQVFSGDASFCVAATMLCTGLYALCAPRTKAVCAGICALMWTGGLLLAAIVLLPFIEFVAHSHRAGGLEAAQALRWSLHPLELLQFVHPYPFGTLVPHTRWFGQHWLDTVYIGIFPLCFAALYLSGRCARKKFLLAAALLGLFLALGAYNPLLSLIMEALPALRLMQYPVKFLLMCAFALAAMSGLGADIFLSRMRARASIRGILKPLLLPVCVLLALLLAAAAGRNFFWNWFAAVCPEGDYFEPLREPLFFELYRGTFIAAALFGSLAVLTWCAIRFKHRASLIAVCIAAAVGADLYFVGAPKDPWLDRSEIRRPGSIVTALQQDDSVYRIYSLSRIASNRSYAHTPHLAFDRVYRVLGQALPPNMHLYHGLASVDEYSELLNVRYYEVFGPVLLHLAGGGSDPDEDRYCRMVFSMLNVKYIISPQPMPGLQFELVRGGPVRLYRNPDVWPRAFPAASVTVCPDDAGVLKRIHAGDFERMAAFIPQSEVARLPQDLQRMLVAGGIGGTAAAAVITGYGANRVDVRVDTEKHALLVLSDTWFPGWRALVNGREQPVVRVNHTLRGVMLQPGGSRVEFVYRPRSFFAGLALSAAAATILVTLCAAGYVLRRRRASAQGQA
jgi:hypothetical protein